MSTATKRTSISLRMSPCSFSCGIRCYDMGSSQSCKYWGSTKCSGNAARFVKNDYHYTNISTVSRMLQDLGWKDPAERRRNLRLALFLRVFTAIPTNNILVTADSRTRAKHQHVNIFLHPPLNTRTPSSPEHSRDWNNCSADQVESRSL